MHPKERHKICGSCDGRIPIDAQLCPYCTADQSFSSGSNSSLSNHHRSLQQSLSAPYTPPYQAKQPGSVPPKESFQDKKFVQPPSLLNPTSIPVPPNEEVENQVAKNVFWPVLLLSIGANLLILGLLQLFFSDQGILRLEWESRYWFIYCLIALPFVFLGLKKTKLLD